MSESLCKHIKNATPRVVFHTDDEWDQDDVFTTARDDLYSVPKLFTAIKDVRPGVLSEKQISRLIPQLNTKMWSTAGERRISPNDVIQRIRSGKPIGDLREHAERIRGADLSVPVTAYRGYLLDGYHRLSKSVLSGAKTLPVKRVKNRAQIRDALIASWVTGSKRDVPIWQAAGEQGLAADPR